MSPPATKPARKALESATRAIARMRSAAEFPEYEDAWNEAIGALEKAWQKMKIAAKADPVRSGAWLVTHEKARESDPLLLYLERARNNDDHSVADGMSHRPGTSSYKIRGTPGVTYIGHLSFDADGAVERYVGNRPLEHERTAARTTLLPVQDRRGTHPPPSSHLGYELPLTDPIAVAEQGLRYYAAALGALEFLVEK